MNRLIEELVAFRDVRAWGQFHTAKNLAAALSIEAGELQETMLWKTDAEVDALLLDPDGRAKIQAEVADVLIFALLFCEAVEVDPEQAVRQKIQENHKKYPVALSRGNATKYDRLKGSHEG